MGATKTEEGVPQGTLLKSFSKESIKEALDKDRDDLSTMIALLTAIEEYIKINAFYEIDNLSSFYMFVGELEISIIRQRQMVVDGQKDLMELSK